MSDRLIPSDLREPSIFAPIDTELNRSARQAIVRPINPPPGIAGFLFDIPEDEALLLVTEISDHYLEDNTSVQDQMALAPEIFTVQGLVGELTSGIPKQIELVRVNNALPDDPNLAPQFTEGAEQAIARQQATEAATTAALTSASSLYGFFDAKGPQPPNQTKQAKIVRYFYELWKSRGLFTVETPWGFLTDMAILTLRAEQGEETRFKSSFRIAFKKVRIAQAVAVSAGQLAGRLNQQMAPVTQNGAAGTTEAPAQKTSLLYDLLAP